MKPLRSLLRAALLAILSTSIVGFSGEEARPPRRFTLFGGVDYGYSSLSTDELSSAHGNQLMLGLTGSFYRDAWVYDIGGGWFQNTIDGQLPNTTTATIRARGGFVELSPRYLLDSHWQIGPAVDAEFGTALGLSALDPNAGPDFRLMGGAKLAYETRIGDFDLRFSFKPLTDLTFPTHRNLLLLAGLEISLPFFDRHPSSEPPATSADEPKPAPVRYNIPLNAVHFQFNSAELDSSSARHLKAIGAALAKNAGLWQNAEITGHTDQRGSHDYNQKLSVRRAHAVAEQLIAGGVSEDRVHESGLAETHPVDPGSNEAAYSKNRRVELLFQGVSDEKALRAILP